MIGIFDSGLGGLTAVREIRKLYPNESLVYFGDTGRVPYGTRSRETIVKYALEDYKFLRSFGIRAVVAACGTVSSTALDELKAISDIPVVGVVEGAAEAAAETSKNRKIGVIGTAATVRSGAFERALREIDGSIEVTSVACPLFVPLVEYGFTSPDDEITAMACERYLKTMAEKEVDTLILGCTHYPIISSVISKVLPGVKLVDIGAESAKRLMKVIGGEVADGGEMRYYVSDDTSMFEQSASVFMGSNISGSVQRVEL